MPFGRGHAAIIAVVVIIVTSIGPVLCITQCLLAYLQLTLRCLDMKSVLFQLFQAFLFVAFLILGCYPCHLRLDSLLLLTSDVRWRASPSSTSVIVLAHNSFAMPKTSA